MQNDCDISWDIFRGKYFPHQQHEIVKFFKKENICQLTHDLNWMPISCSYITQGIPGGLMNVVSSDMSKNFIFQAKLIQSQSKITIAAQTDFTQVSFLIT